MKKNKTKSDRKNLKQQEKKTTGKSCAKALKIQNFSAICLDPGGFSKKKCI